MKTQRLLLTLTVTNFLLLAFLLAQHPVQANTDSSVLRGRSLEIVDDRGRVRASISCIRRTSPFGCPTAAPDIRRP